MAGIMPSVLERYSKASTASVSVTGTYSAFRFPPDVHAPVRFPDNPACGNGIHRCNLSNIHPDRNGFMPWKTPVVPWLMVAACLAVSTPSPAASQPISRTSFMGEKLNQKAPMALLPPPTQAMTALGRRPSFSISCSLISFPMIF